MSSLADQGPTTQERSTRWVALLTVAMMVAEIITGTVTHSLALTADGWHMGSHAGALAVAAFAYWYARTRAKADRFAFGTGKVLALGGYTNALVLAAVAVWMMVEGIERLLRPVDVDFAQALPVAVIGLVVNLVSALILERGASGKQGHSHDHGHAHGHAHGHDDGHDHGTDREHDHGAKETDVNHRAALLHVVADAVTSVLAIAAILAGRYFGVRSLDAAMAIGGSLLILRWSYGLVRMAVKELLDVTPSPTINDRVRGALEAVGDARVVDLRVWQVGKGQRSCVASVVTSAPQPLDAYRAAVREVHPFAHLVIEVDRCGSADAGAGAGAGADAGAGAGADADAGAGAGAGAGAD